MVENVNYSKIEDGFATFIRADKSQVEYPVEKVPSEYKEGDWIKVIIQSEDEIEFLEKDFEKMQEIKNRLAKSKFLGRMRRK